MTKPLVSLLFSVPFLTVTIYLILLIQDLAYQLALIYWFVSVTVFCAWLYIKESKGGVSQK